MKPRTLLACILSVVSIACWISACVSSNFNGSSDAAHNAVFGGHSVVLPGTALTEADSKALNDILSKHDKRIYKIESYNQPAHKKTKGSLRDVFIDKRAAAEAPTNAGKPGFTHDAIQIGVGEKPVQGASTVPQAPLPSPSPGASTVPQQVQASATPAGTSVPQSNPVQALGMVTGSNPQVSKQMYDESAELVRAVEPILKKYSRK